MSEGKYKQERKGLCKRGSMLERGEEGEKQVQEKAEHARLKLQRDAKCM